MLRIRLARTGKRHQATYRVVVSEHTRPTTGKFVEILGYYIPTQNPKVLEIKKERVEYWLSKGAQASDTVHNLLVGKGVLTQKRDIRYARVKTKTAKEEPKPAKMTTEDVEAVPPVEAPVEETETPSVEPTAEDTGTTEETPNAETTENTDQ